MRLMLVWRLPAAIVAIAALSCVDGPESGIAAAVNGYKITLAELERYYASQYQDQEGPGSPEQKQMLRLNLLRELIDRQLMLQKAEALGLTAIDDEVDEQLEQYRSPFDSDEEFAASLADRGMTLEDLRTEIRRRITIEKLFNKEISARISEGCFHGSTRSSPGSTRRARSTGISHSDLASSTRGPGISGLNRMRRSVEVVVPPPACSYRVVVGNSTTSSPGSSIDVLTRMS